MILAKKTIQYILKNFIYILPFCIASGILFILMYDYGAANQIMTLFFTGRIGEITFTTLLRSVSLLNLSSWWNIVISVLSLVGISVLLSMEIALVEKHMRIGKKTLNGVWNKINDNFLSTLGVVALYAAIYEVWSVLLSAIAYAFVALIANAVVQYIFVVLIFAGMLFALLYVFMMFFLWLPCQQITGFRYYESLKYSYQLLSGVKFSLIFLFSLVSFVGFAVVFGVTVLSMNVIHSPALIYVVASVVFTAMFMLFTVGQEVTYFETDQMERADLQPSYKIKY